MSVLNNSKQRSSRRTERLLDVTIRDFSGGWNVVDNDLNMSTKFSKKLSNMRLGKDGSIGVRHGTRLFSSVAGLTNKIINHKYYNGHIVVVGGDGIVIKVDSTGKASVIFNTEFANGLPGSPSAWGTTTFVSFAEFNGELIICNGVNKPLLVNTSMTVTYLNDPATGSNANTPIGKYVQAYSSYLVIAGDPDAVDTLHISSTDTSGVFLGDPAPNDAVDVVMGSRVPQGSSTIKGLGRFRDKAMIAFENSIIIGTLGVFSGADHVPTFDDAIEEQGAISHRVMQTIGEDMMFCDNVGVSSASKALFTGNVKSERLSYLVDPEIQKDIGRFDSTSELENRTFAMYHSLEQSYFLFIPNAGTEAQTNETRCFVYRRIKALKVLAWFEYVGWNWTCATVSALKRVFFGKGTDIFIYGQEQDPIYKDREGAEEMFDDDTSFTDYTGWSPVASTADSGVPIAFIWELPWSDNRERFKVKVSRYINFDTDGDQRFTAKMFVDNLYDDRSFMGETWQDETLFSDGLGWDVESLDPTLELEFVGGTAPGYGSDQYGEFYGGGRPTRHEGLYAWTTKYKLFKLRVDGDAVGPLRFISTTLAYQLGSIRR